MKIRFVLLVAVFFTLVNSIVLLLAGVYESIKGYSEFLRHGVSEVYRPGVYILKGLDLFLVSMVFMIFALGIMRIFTHHDLDDTNLPPWLKINDFKELKILLWETILVTLVVFTFTELVTSKTSTSWEALIKPGIILMLTISVTLMKRHDKH